MLLVYQQCMQSAHERVTCTPHNYGTLVICVNLHPDPYQSQDSGYDMPRTRANCSGYES
jgi:hypothetical protein